MLHWSEKRLIPPKKYIGHFKNGVMAIAHEGNQEILVKVSDYVFHTLLNILHDHFLVTK